MRTFRKGTKEQLVMLETVDLRSAAPMGSTVDIIDKVVDSLDTRKFEEAYNFKSSQGAFPFHPKTLLKVCLLALHSNRFSTRKIEYDTAYNLGYKYLTGNQSIDHSTIGKFINKFKREIVELFGQIVMVCVEKKLVDFKVLAIDTVKIRACASYKNQKNLKQLEKARRRVERKIAGLLENADRNPEKTEQEIDTLRHKETAITEAAEELRERLREAIGDGSPETAAKLEETATINITDHDAQIMKQANGERNPSYAVTTATDSGSDIITGFEVSSYNNDNAALIPAIEGSRENTGNYHEHTAADCGFNSFDNLQYLDEHRIDGLIPDRQMESLSRGTSAKGEYHRIKFSYHPDEDAYHCPQGAILSCRGSITINGRPGKRYANYQACAACPHRADCTKASHREIIRDDREPLQEAMRQKLADAGNKELYNLRAHTAEAPYGCVKRNWKFLNFLRRGIGKTGAEAALLFSLHNILKLGAVWEVACGGNPWS